MSSKLTPLALLIPAVVLAQSAPVPSSQVVMPPLSTMPVPVAKPVNPAKAADALSTAKQLSSKLNSDISSKSKICSDDSSTYYYSKGGYTCIPR
jgi:hypothetical protein